MEPDLSVLIASDRVRTLLPECLRSLQREVQRGGPAIEVVVCSAEPPATEGLSIPIRWARADAGNPARRRNAAAREARGRLFAFLDDDATAEPGWLASGAAALEKADIAGGPDPGPGDAPWGERLSNLLLATPGIGSGVPAHEWNPRGGPVRTAHDVALCNLFVRRETFEKLGGFDESFGYIGEDTDFVRRAMDGGARVQARLLHQQPGLHARGRVVAFLAAAFAASVALVLFGPRFLLPAAGLYAVLTWALSFPIWRRDLALFPAVPLAFAAHHLTYLAGLITGIGRGVFATVFVAAR